jgi:hypothetical protein
MMTIKILVGWEELNIIGHAISWYLGGQFHRMPKPQPTQEQTRTLSVLHENVCNLIRLSLSGVQPIIIEIGKCFVAQHSTVTVPADCFRLMTETVATFFAEIGHSPTEVETITGVPAIKTAEVLSWLQTTCQQLQSARAEGQ